MEKAIEVENLAAGSILFPRVTILLAHFMGRLDVHFF